MSHKPHTVTVRLTDEQYELLRRRAVADRCHVQTIMAAAVNAYALGDLRVTPEGRWWTDGPPAPRPEDDAVRVSAPLPDEPERTVTITAQPQPTRRPTALTTSWLLEHVEERTGHRFSKRMLQRLLSHLEDTRRIEPREGRYWRFTGPQDPSVAAVLIAIDDGTLELLHEHTRL